MRYPKWILAVCVAVVLIAATTVGVAYAHITGTPTNSIVFKGSPPASLKKGVVTSATQVYAYDEPQGVTLGSAVAVDALVTSSTTFPVTFNTFPSGSATIPSGTVVDSHLLHSDIPSSGKVTNPRTGTVTFSTPIIGVIASTARLNSTDATLGAPGTTYAGSMQWRGLESSSGTNKENSGGADSFTITGANTLSINFNTLYFDEIRVLTKHPVPVAAPDSYTANVGSTLTVAAPGVLANDSPGGTAVNFSAASKGTLTPDPSGSGGFSYMPNSGASGTDTFTYQEKDSSGVLSSPATVTITLNQPPVANNDSYLINMPGALNPASSVLANDTDDGGVSNLTAVLVSGPSQASSFSLASDGSFNYTPIANPTGSTDSFTYQAKDANLALSNVATVTITLNQAPVAQNDSSFSTNAGVQLNGSIASDASDDGVPASPPLAFSLVGSGPSHAAPNGFTLNSDGSFSYTPADGYSDTNTPDTFTYQVTDGYGAVSNTAKVSITVYPVVTFTQPATVSNGDTSGTFSLIDPSAPAKRYTASADPTNHVIVFQPSGSTQQVYFRAYLNFGPDETTTDGTLTPGTLVYDPTGGTNYRVMKWCDGPTFDATTGDVTGATLPANESWCIANLLPKPDANGIVTTVWQIFGYGDPGTKRL